MTLNRLSLSINALPDDIIGCILFSRYLELTESAVLSVMLVNWNFLTLGRKLIPYSTSISDEHVLFPNISYLDLYCRCKTLTVSLCVSFMQVKSTLHGLNLRGVDGITNAMMRVIATLTNLKFLDVSSPSILSSNEFSVSGLQLVVAALPHLQWLDVSCTFLSDETIRTLCSTSSKLTHLSMQCCPMVTDLSSLYLSGLQLRSLDITGCMQITIATFHNICAPSCALSRSLQRLSCSYLSLVHREEAVALLLQSAHGLQHLECRNKYVSAAAVPEWDQLAMISPAVVKKAKEKLRTAILAHEDQLALEGLSMIPTAPRITALCPLFLWPHQVEEQEELDSIWYEQ